MSTHCSLTNLQLAERVARIINAFGIIGVGTVRSDDFYFAALRAMPNGREEMVRCMLAELGGFVNNSKRDVAKAIIFEALA